MYDNDAKLKIAQLFIDHLVFDGDRFYFDNEYPCLSLSDIAAMFPDILQEAEDALLEADASHEALLTIRDLALSNLTEAYAEEQQMEEHEND